MIRLIVTLLAITVIVAALHFPYDVDVPLIQQELEATQKYYADAYQTPVTDNQATSEFETDYIRVAKAAAQSLRIEEQVRGFVERFNLRERPVLEIGSGRGYLQDLDKTTPALTSLQRWPASTARNLF